MFTTTEMGSFDPKQSCNFVYRHIEFSPNMDLLERDICIQE